MDRPDRGDHYLMMIAAILQCMPAWIWGKDADPDVAACRLEFVKRDGGQVWSDKYAAPADIPEEELPESWRGFQLPRAATPEMIVEAHKARLERQLRRRAKANQEAGRTGGV